MWVSVSLICVSRLCLLADPAGFFHLAMPSSCLSQRCHLSAGFLSCLVPRSLCCWLSLMLHQLQSSPVQASPALADAPGSLQMTVPGCTAETRSSCSHVVVSAGSFVPVPVPDRVPVVCFCFCVVVCLPFPLPWGVYRSSWE